MSLRSRLLVLVLALAAWAPHSLAEDGVQMATAQEFGQALAAMDPEVAA